MLHTSDNSLSSGFLVLSIDFGTLELFCLCLPFFCVTSFFLFLSSLSSGLKRLLVTVAFAERLIGVYASSVRFNLLFSIFSLSPCS